MSAPGVLGTRRGLGRSTHTLGKERSDGHGYRSTPDQPARSPSLRRVK
jgi:hypothetical protein